jgi:hypothetical protein
VLETIKACPCTTILQFRWASVAVGLGVLIDRLKEMKEAIRQDRMANNPCLRQLGHRWPQRGRMRQYTTRGSVTIKDRSVADTKR